MATLTLHAHGVAPVTLAWERYADPSLWSTWAPQIQGVETTMDRLEADGVGTVHAGLFAWPTLGVPFRVLAVDETAMEWCWEARLGPVRLRLEHGVTDHESGSCTWLRVHGPMPVILGYAPVARIALSRLVAEHAGGGTRRTLWTSSQGAPMPAYVWLAIWVVVILAVAALYVRERRSGRKEVADFERHDPDAVREAGIRADMHGPNGPASTFLG